MDSKVPKVDKRNLIALLELTDQRTGHITLRQAAEAWGYTDPRGTGADLRRAGKRMGLLRQCGLVRLVRRGVFEVPLVPPCVMSGTAWRVWRLMQDGKERTKHDLGRELRIHPDLARRALNELEGGPEPLVISVDFVIASNWRELAVYQETSAALASLAA